MQLARNPAPFVLMRHQKPSTQRCALAFSATTPQPLPEKTSEERTLQQHDRGADRQVRSILLPSRLFTESDHAACWQAGFIDAPALQFLPVVDRDTRFHWRRLDGVGRLTSQQPDGDIGG